MRTPTAPVVRPVVVLSLLAALTLPVSAAVDRPEPRVEDFETTAVGSEPAGWFVPGPARQGGTSVEVTDDDPASGDRCLRIHTEGRASFGNVMRSFDATPYRGMQIRLTASVRARLAAASNARLWVRVDREGGRSGFFDNMGDRPIRETQWRTYEIVGSVHDDAAQISLGLLITGSGTAWMDDWVFEIVGEARTTTEPARPMTERGLANVTAFARLFGYVRHFHPTDEAFTTDWNAFAVRGVRVVEDAADAEDLATRLRILFEPLAPTVTVSAGAAPADDAARAPEGAVGYTRWEHLGFGQGSAAQGIYSSRRDRHALDDRPAAENTPRPGDAVVADLGGGVSCRVPLTVYHDENEKTLPAGLAVDTPLDLDWTPPDGWAATGDDRGTRLAVTILAWNVLHHFYPYFDVVDTDWPAVLTDTLARAAEDPDGDAFTLTLRRLVGALHDGHGFASGPSAMGGFMLPFGVDWVGDDLVVTHVRDVDGVGPAAGDVVTTIDGRTVDELWTELDPIISGATEGWKRHRARQEISRRPNDDAFTIELVKPDGAAYSVFTKPVAANVNLTKEPRPEQIAEIRPGIWYVDIDRITDSDFNAALPGLEEAEGLVFDLRGYPRGLSTVVISHLIDEMVTCAQWHVPQVRWPDRERMTYKFSNWVVGPRRPRLTSNVAFVIDGRAISYAETYMGIIEAYEIATIVGQRTAGTNGNVNPLVFPGGYRVSWTGMRVLKHDGSRHHGVGIEPTVPAERTIAGIAAGRDELLEKAIEVVEAGRH